MGKRKNIYSFAKGLVAGFVVGVAVAGVVDGPLEVAGLAGSALEGDIANLIKSALQSNRTSLAECEGGIILLTKGKRRSNDSAEGGKGAEE